MTSRKFTYRFSASFALLMVGAGIQLPFLPLWLEAKGLTAHEIATVIASMMASRAVASPVLTYLADRLRNRVAMIRICTAFTVTSFAVLAQVDGFWPILGLAMCAAFAFAPVFPLSEAYTVDASHARGLDYGRLRLWASLGFLAASLTGGALLTRLAAVDAIWLIFAGQCCALVATFLLPSEQGHLPHHDGVAQETAQSLAPLLLSSFALVLLAVSLGQSSHALMNSFSSVYWSGLGFSTFFIGVFWTMAVLTEVLFFLLSKLIVQRVSYHVLILVGLFGGIVRWIGMGWLTDPFATALLQMLHAVSFATTHFGTMHYIQLQAPPRLRNTAQGLYAAFSGGVMMAAMTWASGQAYDSFGGHAFFLMAGVSTVALACALLVFWLNPRARATAGG